MDRLVVNEDVTDDVDMENGHPSFESICNIMQQIGEEYLKAKGAID